MTPDHGWREWKRTKFFVGPWTRTIHHAGCDCFVVEEPRSLCPAESALALVLDHEFALGDCIQ